MTSSLISVSDFIGSPLPPRVRHRLPDCAATAQGHITHPGSVRCRGRSGRRRGWRQQRWLIRGQARVVRLVNPRPGDPHERSDRRGPGIAAMMSPRSLFVFRTVARSHQGPYPPTALNERLPAWRRSPWLRLRQPQDHAFVGFEHEIPRVEGAVVAPGIGGQLQDGGAVGAGERQRHTAGTEVQRDEEPPVELPFEAEDVRCGADEALRAGLQRGSRDRRWRSRRTNAQLR